MDDKTIVEPEVNDNLKVGGRFGDCLACNDKVIAISFEDWLKQNDSDSSYTKWQRL